MGYQALLFCPDEKLASVVNQVFNELDFTVEAVHEPFAAVKKLMTQHYDAIVVDSENDQNASLLFKSARNSSSNQGSWRSLWSKDKWAWPRPTASAPTLCSQNRSTLSRPRERFGLRADFCGKIPIPPPALAARHLLQFPQELRHHRPVVHRPVVYPNRPIEARLPWLRLPTVPRWMKLKLRSRR